MASRRFLEGRKHQRVDDGTVLIPSPDGNVAGRDRGEIPVGWDPTEKLGPEGPIEDQPTPGTVVSPPPRMPPAEPPIVGSDTDVYPEQTTVAVALLLGINGPLKGEVFKILQGVNALGRGEFFPDVPATRHISRTHRSNSTRETV